MHENTETFKIASLPEAEAFAAHLRRYAKATRGEATSTPEHDICDPILTLYNYSRVYSKDDRINGKLLHAYVDLELTCLFMLKDVLLAAGAHNQLHDDGKTALASVLDNFELFSGKMDILYALSALSFRMRAFWDKYIGMLFLLYDNENYDKYVDNNTKRGFFKRHAQEWPEISTHLRKCLTNIVRTAHIHSGQPEAVKDIDNWGFVPFPDPFLTMLDRIIAMVDYIRTPEAHHAGFLRKWTLANLPIDKSRDFSLINHWNISIEFMRALRATIADRLRTESNGNSLSNDDKKS